MRDGGTAEDLVQETFLAALKAGAGYRGDSSVRTWLTGILKHKIVDHLRRKYREQPEDPEDLPFEGEDLFQEDGPQRDHWNPALGPRDLAPDPSGELERREFWKVLGDCLEHLPERLKIAFSLREISNLTTEEICKDLEVTPTNLWVMLHRARMQVRRCLEVHWNE